MPNPSPSQPAENDSEVLVIVRFDEIHVPAAATPATRSAVVPIRTQAVSLPPHDELETELMSLADATHRLRDLRAAEVILERVNVMHVLGDGPDYLLQTWRCEPAIGEASEAFGARAYLLAEDFLSAYPDPGDGSIRYVLFTSETSPALRAA